MKDHILSETTGWGAGWYGSWMDLTDMDLDENTEVPDNVGEWAKQLHEAGAGKWLGCGQTSSGRWPRLRHPASSRTTCRSSVPLAMTRMSIGSSRMATVRRAVDGAPVLVVFTAWDEFKMYP